MSEAPFIKQPRRGIFRRSRRDTQLAKDLAMVTQLGFVMAGSTVLGSWLGYGPDAWLNAHGLVLVIFILLGFWAATGQGIGGYRTCTSRIPCRVAGRGHRMGVFSDGENTISLSVPVAGAAGVQDCVPWYPEAGIWGGHRVNWRHPLRNGAFGHVRALHPCKRVRRDRLDLVSYVQQYHGRVHHGGRLPGVSAVAAAAGSRQEQRGLVMRAMQVARAVA